MRTLVVGASGELGSAIARRLARGKHQLVLHGYSDHLALNSVADEVGAIDIAYVDARSEQAIRDAVVQAASSGPLNGLVYAAGINPTAATVANTSSEDWINTIAINLTGAFFYIREAIPFLRRDAPASIVLISSVFGITSPANRGAYGASKHALAGLVQSVAREETERVRINAVCPGPMWSENVRRIFAQHANSLGISVEDYVKERRARIPFGRFLEFDECASLVEFLLGNDARFLTGEMVRISGGEG